MNSSRLSAPAAIPYWRLSSFYFFYFAVVGAFTPFWNLYLKSLGYTSQDVGIISAIILATRIIAPNFWGWLADKTSRRLRIIRQGSAIACVFFAGIFISQSYWWLVFVISCYSFFWYAVLPQFEVLTLGHLGQQFHRYSQIRLWGSIGFIAAVVGLGWLFDFLPIRYLPMIILSFLVLIWLSSLTLGPAAPNAHGVATQGFFKQVFKPAILCFLVASFLMQLSHGPYYTFYSIFLHEHYHYSSTATGCLWALGVVAEVGIFLLMPTLMRRFSVRELLLWSFIITAVRWCMIGYLADQLWLLLFAQLLHAFSFGVAHAASIDIVRTQFKGAHQGQGQALYSSLSFGIGGALGALGSGLLWDHSASFTFFLAAIAAFGAFVVAFFGLHLNDSNSH